mmetsp:Transcript_21993/g.63107  ORF Transcript_21993/g.63107 Transcript_21993/m.63107 type:complete len:215 (+) Transcript_21993:769-1413(+)
MDARPEPIATPSASTRSKIQSTRAKSLALTAHMTRHDQTMRVGVTPWSARMSCATSWHAKSSRQARDSNLTRMEKVMQLGRTPFSLMSAKSRRPNCKSPTFTQPSSNELNTISSHSKFRACNSSASLTAFCSSPLLQYPLISVLNVMRSGWTPAMVICWSTSATAFKSFARTHASMMLLNTTTLHTTPSRNISLCNSLAAAASLDFAKPLINVA